MVIMIFSTVLVTGSPITVLKDKPGKRLKIGALHPQPYLPLAATVIVPYRCHQLGNLYGSSTWSATNALLQRVIAIYDFRTYWTHAFLHHTAPYRARNVILLRFLR